MISDLSKFSQKVSNQQVDLPPLLINRRKKAPPYE